MNQNKIGRILAAGVGNSAMSDDSVGVRIIEELRKREWPENIDFVMLDYDPVDLLTFCEQYECLVLIDAVSRSGNPGQLHIIAQEDFFKEAKRERPCSLHQLGLSETLKLARALGYRFRFFLFGIEFEDLSPGFSLSRKLADRFSGLVDEIASELLKISNKKSKQAICNDRLEVAVK